MTYKEKIIECQIVNQGFAYSQQQLCIKTISIHDYSQLQDLKQNLLEIHDYVTAEAASKVVNELFDCAAIRKNYTLFRGKDRLVLIPNNAKTEQI